MQAQVGEAGPYSIYFPTPSDQDFNISTSVGHTVLELAEVIWKKLNGDVPFEYVSDEPFQHDVQMRVPCVQKAKDAEMLGIECLTSLEEALEEVIPWIKEQDYGPGWTQLTDHGKIYLSKKEKNVFILEGTKSSGFSGCCYGGSPEERRLLAEGVYALSAELKCMPQEQMPVSRTSGEAYQQIFLLLDCNKVTDLSSGCDFLALRMNFDTRELRVESQKRHKQTVTHFAQPNCSILRPQSYLTVQAEFSGETMSLTVSGISMVKNLRDIGGLEDAKRAINEAVILPLLMPEFFVGLRDLAPASKISDVIRIHSKRESCLIWEVTRVPSILFFDEIDSLLSQRGGPAEHEASRRFKSEFLIHMDGLLSDAGEQNGRLWRNENARHRMLEHFLKEIDLSDVDLAQLATRLERYSGADVQLVCREASMNPMRRLVEGLSPSELVELRAEGKLSMENLSVSMSDFEDAIHRVQPSVSHSDTQRYLDWQKDFGSHIRYDITSRHAFWWEQYFPRWEMHTFRVFQRFVRPGAVVLDAGGWIGSTALWLAERARKVVVLEPGDRAFEELLLHVAQNPTRTRSRLSLLRAALGPKRGLVQMTNRGDSADQVGVFDRQEGILSSVFGINDLLYAFPELEDVSFIKIDVVTLNPSMGDGNGGLSIRKLIGELRALCPQLYSFHWNMSRWWLRDFQFTYRQIVAMPEAGGFI
eukprot:g4485.t1